MVSIDVINATVEAWAIWVRYVRNVAVILVFLIMMPRGGGVVDIWLLGDGVHGIWYEVYQLYVAHSWLNFI